VRVIDSDLGLSGQSADSREGFRKQKDPGALGALNHGPWLSLQPSDSHPFTLFSAVTAFH
jgi:hypothetical protein